MLHYGKFCHASVWAMEVEAAAALPN